MLPRPPVDPRDVDENAIAARLYAPEMREPDLLIRTSNELRVSNFLLWQLAYSEIYVTPTLFPDFRRRHMFEAIIEFQKRDRRFGGVEGQNHLRKRVGSS